MCNRFLDIGIERFEQLFFFYNNIREDGEWQHCAIPPHSWL